MPSISNKGQEMPQSPIRKLVPFAEHAKKAGKKIYHLNIGQPDIETPKEMMDAVRNIDMKVLEYSHSAGNESYRRNLAEYYAKNGILISYDNIIITTGGSEALLFGMMSCLDEGDEVIIPEPFYANYNGFAAAAGIKIRPIISEISTGFSLPPIDAFEHVITPRTKAIMICNPSNPTGYLYSQEELEGLRSIVKKHDLFLFADEVYREFCYDGEKHHSILNIDGLDENAIVVDSISKRYSACGARIGALISRNSEVMDTALKFAQARLSPPSLAQIAAEAALNVPDDYFTAVIGEYEQRRNLVVSELNNIEGVMCPNPGGAFYVVAQLPVDDTEKFCQWMLEAFDHEGETVMMAPAAGFYSTPGRGLQEVRIAYVLDQKDLKRAMEVLGKGIDLYRKQIMQATEFDVHLSST